MGSGAVSKLHEPPSTVSAVRPPAASSAWAVPARPAAATPAPSAAAPATNVRRSIVFVAISRSFSLERQAIQNMRPSEPHALIPRYIPCLACPHPLRVVFCKTIAKWPLACDILIVKSKGARMHGFSQNRPEQSGCSSNAMPGNSTDRRLVSLQWNDPVYS